MTCFNTNHNLKDRPTLIDDINLALSVVKHVHVHRRRAVSQRQRHPSTLAIYSSRKTSVDTTSAFTSAVLQQQSEDYDRLLLKEILASRSCVWVSSVATTGTLPALTSRYNVCCRSACAHSQAKHRHNFVGNWMRARIQIGGGSYAARVGRIR